MGAPVEDPGVVADGADRDGVAPPSSETIERRIELETQLLAAAKVASQGILTAEDPREAKEWAQTALALAQSIVILDPDLVAPQGVPIDAIHPPAPRSGAARIPTDKSRSAQSG